MRTTILLALSALFLGCGKSEPPPAVGLVFDIGGRGDKSFNDSAYNGLEKARAELGTTYRYIEPVQGSFEPEAGLRQLAEQGVPLVFGIGFAFTESINAVARDFPNQKFGCIDYDFRPDTPVPPNVSALRFREEEGSFLVGVVAGLFTKTGKIGFVGGMDIPLIHKFRAGYEAGARAARPDVQVIVNFAGTTPTAFKDPVKGKELARSQYAAGADIVFHASGSTGNGVLEAAKELNKDGVRHFVIGVDADQWEPGGHVLTSMIKGVDVAVFNTIREHKAGTFRPGLQTFGLKENGVGYVRDDRNRSLVTDDIAAKVEAFRKDIVDGKITVPSK